MNQTVTYLQELTAIPSPTGFTREIADYLVKTIEGFGYEVTRTAKGGVNVTVPGVITDKQRYVTAHVDTLGAIVRAVKADGRLKLDRIGGFPWNMIEGENCTVHVANTGKTHSGTILVHQTSCHVYKDAGTVERTQDNMEVRLDEKVTNEKETRALGIEVGDFVSFDPRTIVTDTGFIKSRHLDDKVSAAILLNLLRVYKEEQIQLPVTTTFAFSVFEEVGHGANSSIPAEVVEYLAVDMGAMGDDQATDEYTVSICVKDASGPYHYEFRQHLVALAKDWTVSQDGLTYTYKLRDDAKWYDSEGEEYADVTAKDFVTGIKYAADNKSEMLYIIQDSIKGLNDYVSGKNKDFSAVGVKAVDDHTLQITLNQPESYWNSKLTLGITFPVNEKFVKSKGDKFAQASDTSSLLYNGPYILKSFTSKSSIEMTKNENYWDKDKVYVSDVKLEFYDGQDQSKLAKSFGENALSLAKLFPTGSGYSEQAKEFKDEITYTPQDAASYVIGTNIDRQSYKHTAKKTDEEKQSTKKALLNKDFRQAISFAFNREAYAAQLNGKDGASKIIRNLYIPPTFVQADGKTFGEMVKTQLDTYGDEWKSTKLDDGQNGLFDAKKAKEEFAKAKTALEADGVKFPIHIDMPVDQTTPSRVQRVQSFKQSVEEALGKENVVIDIQMLSKEDLQNVTLFAPNAAGEDWDLSDNVGWSPDYQDPSTYMDILKASSGENTKTFLGFDPSENNEAAKKVGLYDFEKMIKDAGAETQDVNKRYEKYAAAQAWLTDSALVMPTSSSTGRPFLTRIEPFSAPFAWTGGKGKDHVIYKGMKLQDKAVTSADYNKALEKWQKEQAESNKKAQEDLKKHVK